MKKILLACALFLICMVLSTTNAQASSLDAPGKTDSKRDILWHDAMRVDVQEPQHFAAEVYFKNPKHYISSVKSNSPNLLAMIISDITATNPGESIYYCQSNDTEYFRGFRIGFFATKKGSYKVTFTVKNAAKKTVTKKTIKVYAGYPNTPIKSITYAGKKYLDVWNSSSFTTKKASGKLKLVANQTYKIKKIEIATAFDTDGNPVYKKIKNGAKIKLATKTAYRVIYSESDSYRYGYEMDFLKPMTQIRVTYYDQKLKKTSTEEYSLINIK